MIELLKFLEMAKGSYAAAAGFLGYSERQYYNLRRSILKGAPLKLRVKTLIIGKVSRLKTENAKEPHDMNKESAPRLGRNVGRIEFIAVSNKVQALLDAGYDRKKTHAKLVEEGLVTMSYSTFCNQLKKAVAAIPQPSQSPTGLKIGQHRPKPLATGQSASINAPIGRAAKTEPFSIDRSKTLEDLV
jgi:hypothetical protein